MPSSDGSKAYETRPSPQAGDGARGFLLDLSRAFEEFVEAEVRRAVRGYGGRIVAQERAPLDRDGRVHIRPDLVWRDSQGVRAVFDAKYKAEKLAGFPNADIYQMLVYCVRHRVPTGHLIYAAGNEPQASHIVEEAGVTMLCHALDLDAPGPAISAQVNAVVAHALVVLPTEVVDTFDG